MNTRQGFTLIELVIVLVVLGILSAIAIPRYISMQSQARLATLNGLLGTLNAAIPIVKASWIAAGKPSTVTLDNGATVAVYTTGSNPGVPNATSSGVGNAFDYSGVTAAFAGASPGTATFTITTNCAMSYTDSIGVPSLTTSGC